MRLRPELVAGASLNLSDSRSHHTLLCLGNLPRLLVPLVSPGADGVGRGDQPARGFEGAGLRGPGVEPNWKGAVPAW